MKGRESLINVLLAITLYGCGETGARTPVLSTDLPLHLEDYLDAAVVEGSQVPDEIPEPAEWSFEEPQPGWQATIPRPYPPNIRAARVEQTPEALRITLGPANANPRGYPVGGAYVSVPEWNHRDWDVAVIRARALAPGNIGIAFNLRERGADPDDTWPYPYEKGAQSVRLVGDSTVQTYRLRMEATWQPWDEPVRELGLWLGTEDSLTVEILSITVVPKEASYAEEPAGVRHLDRGNRYRRALFVHTPARLQYRVQVPEGGRLDTGLGTLWSDPLTTFRVSVATEGSEAVTLLEEAYGDRDAWAQRSVDLGAYAGQVVTLALEVDSEREGTVAFWAAPTVTGSAASAKPNVIFYVIDGGGADQMSVYGYGRRTTPFLEQLAAEGAVFEHAYSNSSWSKPSTTSFMTSLQNSVLGNVRDRFDPLPEQARTMAQRFHGAGYQTAVLTTNPWAATASSLERGVDLLREERARPNTRSSMELHRDFWTWREQYPGTPFWTHFQTTDVHGPTTAQAPFAGLYLPLERRGDLEEWWERISEWYQETPPPPGTDLLHSSVWEDTGLDRLDLFGTVRDVYDEALFHQDYQLRRFVERLEVTGQWENTILVVGADHSTNAAGSWDLGQVLQDSLPPTWGPIFRSYVSRVPLIFVWSGHITAGARFAQPVSNVDVLPTLLDLAGLPMPEAMQGRSLAPLLLGRVSEAEFGTRPVILDEFWAEEESGELQGKIEVIDGRWGASMWVGPPGDNPQNQYPVPVLVYDLWEDPLALYSLHEERPDLVQKYTEFLEKQWEAHQALAQRFSSEGEIELTAEQLEALRTLGYIR